MTYLFGEGVGPLYTELLVGNIACMGLVEKTTFPRGNILLELLFIGRLMGRLWSFPYTWCSLTGVSEQGGGSYMLGIGF